MSETTTTVQTTPRAADKPETGRPRLWNVVLLDDDEHSYEYVIAMVQRLFGYPTERAFQIAKRVDTQGRAIVLTTHREHAELKVQQIHGFGADPFIASCRGSMSAVLEPADLGGEDDGPADSDRP